MSLSRTARRAAAHSASKTRVNALMGGLRSLTSSSTRTKTLSKRSRPLSQSVENYFICNAAVSLRRGDMPDAVDAVAGHVARLGILGELIERLALVGPLFAAVVARDDGPVARRLGVGAGQERRPVGGALAIAVRFAAGIAVERVERQTLGVDQGLALGRVRAFRRRRLRQRCCDADRENACSNRGCDRFSHD